MAVGSLRVPDLIQCCLWSMDPDGASSPPIYEVLMLNIQQLGFRCGLFNGRKISVMHPDIIKDKSTTLPAVADCSLCWTHEHHH